MRKNIPLAFVLFLFVSLAQAQKKNLSWAQVFGGEPTRITQPLPVIKGWLDDEHYLQLMPDSPGGKPHLVSVEVKSGKAIDFTGKVPGEKPEHTDPALKDFRNATVSPDGNWVAYTKKDNNLYVRRAVSGQEVQLTKDGSETILNGYASWIYYEEILGRASRYRAFWWSPDSKRICFMRFDESQVPVYPIYWNDGQHGYVENTRYPQPGDKNPEVRIGIVAPEQPDQTTWADFNAADDQYFGQPLWTPSAQLWVQWMNRGQNNLKIYNVNAVNGTKTEIYDEKQKTWIDLDEANRVQFLSGDRFILKSDKDGWENLYLYNANGRLLNAVTSGNFWGTEILRIDEKNKVLYFRARKENSTRFDIYRVNLDGREVKRLSFGNFTHDQVSVSPMPKYLITTYSNAATPPAMAILDVQGRLIRQVANSKGPDFEGYNLPNTSLVRVKSADSLFDLPVLITYPLNFDPSRKYPVVVSIYGGPNAGTVYDRWRPAISPTQWWAQEGIVQVTFDNRSSGHFGKNGLNYIYRQLGKYEIEDYMSCGRWLRSQPWIDSSRVAIMGGSFGGYMTCMALTYGANVFTHGIAMSSVTDWKLYDTHYTERYMNTPADNPDGYKATSVLTYADQYKGLLRIVHGSADDNVHMQNSMQLINKLEDMRKHFEFMIYPGERHGFRDLKAQHNRTEIYKFFYDYLLNKRMPADFWNTNQPRMAF